ncbi:restriction endonuclease subunit S [uncultured Veillonella sp.]|uniref:restriction endonuclease subunit S n=1 Tax=uncultured Veillonella sp. TaxID=159268 RepID=UPI00258B8276|nr:restriction endonuclease subunit S [uncultured Veillonella sp.]
MGDLVKRITRKNKNLESNRVLTISAQYGLVDQLEFFGKQVASKDLSGYYYLEAGDFAYNKSYSNGYPWGAVKRLNQYSHGVVSSLYIVFRPERVNSNFLEKYYDTTLWYREIYRRASEGARNHGLLNISPEDFFNSNLMIPCEEEQEKIEKALNYIDHHITVQQRKSVSKDEVMNLFLCKSNTLVDIDVYANSWEQRRLGEIGSVEMNKRILKKDTLSFGEIPFYKIGTFGGEADAYISRELFETYKSKYPYPKVGDLLISASGSIGKIVEYTGKDEYFQDSNIVWLNHNDKVKNIFLKFFYEVVRWDGIEGSTIKRLYNKNILNTKIWFPTSDEQQKIGQFFEQFDHHITFQQRM